MNNKVIIITGEKGEGKTTKLRNIVSLLKNEGIQVIGFVALGNWKKGDRHDYRLADINSQKSIILCTVLPIKNYKKHGKFYFNQAAINFGTKLLKTNSSKNLVVVIDEIGPFELENKVWHTSLKNHLETTQNTILITVRKKLVNNIIDKYKLKEAIVYSTSEPNENIINKIHLPK